jgi:hypothetical protein
MPQYDAVDLAALDLIIAKKQQDFSFITDIVDATQHAAETITEQVTDGIEGVTHIVEATHGVTEVTEAVTDVTEGGFADTDDVAGISLGDKLKQIKTISIDDLIALRERMAAGIKKS